MLNKIFYVFNYSTLSSRFQNRLKHFKRVFMSQSVFNNNSNLYFNFFKDDKNSLA